MKNNCLQSARMRMSVIAALLLLGAASANASLYSGFAVADLTITSVSSTEGLIAQGLSFNEEEQGIHGNANALADGLVLFSPSATGAGLGLSVSAYAEGFTDPPEGEANSLAIATGGVKLENMSDSAIDIDYSVGVLLDVLVEALTDNEDAFVDATIDILVDGMVLESFAIFADALIGPEFDFLELGEDYSLTLDPSEYVEIEITSSVIGLATTVVPVPAALPLMFSALAGLAAFSRRRKAS
jgi:hypothetical protein